jgi:3-isopropylmalate dehydrogenase
MAKYRIAWLPGDGIGNEVLEAAYIVLSALGLDAEYVRGDVGWKFWCEEGNPLPDRTLEMLKTTDCCLFGAITSKPKQEAEAELSPKLKNKGYSYYSPMAKLRQELDLYICMRPCKAYKGNPLIYKEGIDIVVFRENTEGLYSGVEFYPLPQEVRDVLLKYHRKMGTFKDVPLEEIALSSRIMTYKACYRIVKAAFEYARKHKRRSVTVVEKPNVLRETGGLMLRVAREVAKEYPEIPLWEANVDAMCMWLLKNPLDYDVLVAENMFGDIISDLCGQLVGGLGFACSGNIGDNYAIFEPTHGSAPKYAGQYKVNPMATLLSVKMMLEYLKEETLAARLEQAISGVLSESKVRTYDLGGTSSTLEVARAVATRIWRA